MFLHIFEVSRARSLCFVEMLIKLETIMMQKPDWLRVYMLEYCEDLFQKQKTTQDGGWLLRQQRCWKNGQRKRWGTECFALVISAEKTGHLPALQFTVFERAPEEFNQIKVISSILRLTEKFRAKKSLGPEGTPFRVLQDLRCESVDLNKKIKLSLKAVFSTEYWKVANMLLIFKVGSEKRGGEPGNYNACPG